MVTFTRISKQRAEQSTNAVVFAFCRRPCIAVWKHQSCAATFSWQRQTLFQGFYCTWKRIVEALQLRRPATMRPYSCADRPELRISLEVLCNRSIAFVVAGARVTSIDALNDHTQLSALLRIKQRVRKVIVDNCKRDEIRTR